MKIPEKLKKAGRINIGILLFISILVCCSLVPKSISFALTGHSTNITNSGILITIHPENKVSGERIYLKDIADIKAEAHMQKRLENIEIGKSPYPGRKRKSTLKYIIAQIKSSRILKDLSVIHGPDYIYISRAFQTISNEMLQQIFIQFYSEKLQGKQYELSNIKATNKKKYPEGRLVLNLINNKKTAFIKRAVLKLSVTIDRKSFGRITISGWIDRFEKVSCLAHDIKKNRVLMAEDIIYKSVNMAKVKSGRIHTAIDAVGKRVKRDMKKGSLLYARALDIPPVIKKGDRILLVALVGTLRVTIPGIAKSEGFVGDQIRVENVRSGKTILGYIRDSNTVEVLF